MTSVKAYIATALLLLSAAVGARGAVHTVADVPNVHRADARRYVADPDGLLSPSMRDSLDAAIARVWRTTTAELAVVVLDQVEGGDIDTFATELFTHWGIGKEDNDNGVLYLVAIGDRRAAIRTGYGAEGVVPDALAGRIIRSSNSHYKAGDVDRGVAEAVGQLSRLLLDPGAADELLSELPNDRRSGAAADDDEAFAVWLKVSGIIAAMMLLWLVATMMATRGKNRHQRYLQLQRLQLPMAVMACATVGMGLIALLPLLFIMRRLRVGRRRCPNCGVRMKRLDEKSDNAYLTPAQDVEERINSVDYDVWLCPGCGETDILPYVNRTADYQVCPTCGARASRLAADRILRQPTPTSEGQGVKVYACRNCRKTNAVSYVIPKAAAPVVILPPIGGRGGGFSGGGFSGGSFGGGATGGGGASGGW